MPLPLGRYGLRVLVAAALCVCSATVPAEAPAPPDASQIKLDGAISGLKEEVLSFNREALGVENDVLYPAHTRTNIYAGVRVTALLLKTISVSVDDQPAQTYTYSDQESRALLNSEGLHRVLRVSLEPGAHRIKADYSAQFADAKPDAAPINGHYEAIFDKYVRETELELLIARGSRLSEPQMRLSERKLAAANEAIASDKPARKRFRWRTP